MTDITDQDRRLALRWCDMLGDSTLHEEAAATRRVILATVEAPDPTPADELRDVADNYGMSSRASDRLHNIADRVEHDLAEARAEVERAEDRAAEWQGIAQRYYAKVELLTAERDEKEVLDAIDAHCDHYAAQKGAESNAESNAESIDPADVKPGEAWKANIWYDGVHQPGTAIKSAGSSDWVVIRDDGSRSTFRMNEYVELVSRLVPAPRVITNPDELEQLAATTAAKEGEQ